MPIKTTLLLTFAFLCTGCAHQGHLLVGQWEFDGQRTLIHLKEKQLTPRKVKHCYETNVCGKDVVLTYTRNKWTQYFTFNKGQPSPPMPYQILSRGDDWLEIETEDSDGYVKFKIHFDSPDTAYLSVNYNDFIYNDYLKRINATQK